MFVKKNFVKASSLGATNTFTELKITRTILDIDKLYPNVSDLQYSLFLNSDGKTKTKYCKKVSVKIYIKTFSFGTFPGPKHIGKIGLRLSTFYVKKFNTDKFHN